MDADLRRPTLHRRLGLSNQVGFTSVVSGIASLTEALHPTGIPNLFVLTSGPLPPNPPELLDSQAGRSLFRQIAETSDFVVVDSPPALVMADAQIVCTMMDAVVLVVSSIEAHKRELARTTALVQQTGAKVLGLVLTKVQSHGSHGYGYYKYSNYASYFEASPDDDQPDQPNPSSRQSR